MLFHTNLHRAGAVVRKEASAEKVGKVLKGMEEAVTAAAPQREARVEGPWE